MRKIILTAFAFMLICVPATAQNFRRYPYGESQRQFVQHGYGGYAHYDSRYIYGVNTGRPRQPYVTPNTSCLDMDIGHRTPQTLVQSTTGPVPILILAIKTMI